MSIDETRSTHESYGQLGFTRWTSGGKHAFYGSDLKHDRGITMRLHESELIRHLNYDRHHADRLICEVRLTEAQFAEMITSMNTGDGVPVTITMRHTEGFQKMEETPFAHKGEQVLKEVRDDAKRATTELRAALKRLEGLVTAPGNVSKTMLKDILSELKSGASAADDHLPFIVDQFSKVVEKMVVDATATISARGNAMSERLENMSQPQLPGPEEQSE